jgi:hypothetical protein
MGVEINIIYHLELNKIILTFATQIRKYEKGIIPLNLISDTKEVRDIKKRDIRTNKAAGHSERTILTILCMYNERHINITTANIIKGRWL